MLLDDIKEYYKEEKNIIDSLNLKEVGEAVEAIANAYEREASFYVFGNGGSANTASHLANDFNKCISDDLTRKFSVTCLCDNTATLMAIANDISYDEIFRFQLKGRLKKGDVIIAISGSGNSKNIVKAAEYAREVGATVIGISGYSGGELYELADYHMHVPVNDMQIAEDIHLTFDHMMCRVLKKRLTNNE